MGVRLSAACFNPIISAHGKASPPALAAAQRVFSLMQQAHVQPTLTSFNALAAAHDQEGDVCVGRARVHAGAVRVGHTLRGNL